MTAKAALQVFTLCNAAFLYGRCVKVKKIICEKSRFMLQIYQRKVPPATPQAGQVSIMLLMMNNTLSDSESQSLLSVGH